jgi:hypothetical protein
MAIDRSFAFASSRLRYPGATIRLMSATRPQTAPYDQAGGLAQTSRIRCGISHQYPYDLLPRHVYSKLNGSFIALARDDMDESDFMVVSFVENPVVLEGEAGEVGRKIMICFADTRKARN